VRTNSKECEGCSSESHRGRRNRETHLITLAEWIGFRIGFWLPFFFARP
jgi:hypothetical protein